MHTRWSCRAPLAQERRQVFVGYDALLDSQVNGGEAAAIDKPIHRVGRASQRLGYLSHRQHLHPILLMAVYFLLTHTTLHYSNRLVNNYLNIFRAWQFIVQYGTFDGMTTVLIRFFTGTT